MTVDHIIDGDTLELAALTAGSTLSSTARVDVRLLDIDTPETQHPNEPVQCYGNKATTALKRLLPPGSTAWVQRDEELRNQHESYLLYLWTDDGVFVNLNMVKHGYARAVLYEQNNRHWSRISAAEREAKQADEGLWGACSRFGAPANEPEPEPEPEPELDKPDKPRGGSGNYPVAPPPPDKDCSEVPNNDFRVRPGDPHRFDADGDGIGCES